MINDLFNEEILKPKKKKTIKPSTIIIIFIILLTILCIVAICAIVYIKSTILSITLDGLNAKDLENILIIEETNKVYMPIKKMAEYLGYKAYTGDYITLSEDDTSKCYIITEEETVSFVLNSNVITKVINGQTQQTKILEPIKEINGELCISSEGAQSAFSFKFYYDTNHNNISIYTLAYLYEGYSSQALKLGYVQIEKETNANKLAVLDDMLIVQTSDNYYGVMSIISNELILEAKYDSIEYFQKASEFVVESKGKKGIISKDQKTKIELMYDSIQRVTNKDDIFYVIGKSGSYGLLDEKRRNDYIP